MRKKISEDTDFEIRHTSFALFLILNYIHIPTFAQDTTRENKLRLLMILAAVYPEKFDGEKGLNLMKVSFLVSAHFEEYYLSMIPNTCYPIFTFHVLFR